MTKARQSHQEKELQMSLVTFTARNMPNISLEKKYKTLKTWKQELTPRRTSVTKRWEMKYQTSHKTKYKPPLITSKKVQHVTTTESGPKTSRHALQRRKKWSDRSSTKCWSKRTAHQKLGEGIRFKVTYKEKKVEEVGNYRPICTVPALYKLFSTIICNRLYHRLDQAQSEDQGGYRRSYQTLDHLATYRLREWCTKMWVATVDFMKAFDSISQRLNNAVSNHITSTSWGGYSRNRKGQSQRTEKATCLRWREERSRGILCPVYSSTRCSKRHRKMLWFAGKNQKGMGVRLGGYESDCLTNLRFADDVLLFTTLPAQLQKWCVTSNDTQRGWDWKSTRKKRKFSAIKIRTQEEKWRSTTSKSLNCTNEKEVQEEDTETQRRKIIRGPQIPCWIETHRRMKWRLAMRIASLPDKPWTKKTAKWNPGLGPKHQTNRPVGSPEKRWEDDINEFLKPEETDATKGREIKNNGTWIRIAQRKGRWKEKEDEFADEREWNKEQWHMDQSGKKKKQKDGEQWKVNTQRQQPQCLLTVYKAEEILRKIQSDQHATWTVWGWMIKRWRTCNIT